MTLTQIEYFLAILQYDGFSAAANEIFISQSSLSKQIKSLEAELGVTLFYRANNKVSLTPAGAKFNEYAERIYSNYTEMLHSLEDFQAGNQKKSISLGALPLVQNYHLLERLTQFQAEMNQIQIDLTENNQEELLSLLEKGKLDLAILRTDYLDPAIYEFASIRKDKFVLVCAKNQIQVTHGEEVSLKHFEKLPFVVMNQESTLYNLCNEHFEKAGFKPNIRFTASRHLYLLNLVNTGLGVTLLPRDLVNTDEFPNLICVPFKEAQVSSIGIVRQRQNRASRCVQLLFDYFADNGLSTEKI